MKIEQINLEDIAPYHQNNRTHPDQQIDRIAASIKEFGFTQPIVLDKNSQIIAGHGRHLAAQKLGLKTIPAVRLESLSEKQIRAYRILDNKLQNDSTWNIDNLSLELDWLEHNKWDLLAWGLDELMFDTEEEPEVKEDDFQESEQKTTYIKRGDLIELGRHRVLCGDSTSSEDVSYLMEGATAVLMQTDPPYGIAYVSNAQSKGQAKDHIEIENDELDGERLQKFLEDTIKAALPFLKDNCAFYLWHPMLTQGTFFAAAAAAAADILIHRQIIWCKPSLVFGRGDYHWQHELCFYGWRRGHKPEFFGARNQTTLWHIGRETSKEHPTAKPVELWSAPIRNHTKARDVAYEPFLGSGSQLIACEQLNRTCYGIEIEPKYCQVIIDRYRKHCEDNNKPCEIKINGERFEQTRPQAA